jgi:hypothetical protein
MIQHQRTIVLMSTMKLLNVNDNLCRITHIWRELLIKWSTEQHCYVHVRPNYLQDSTARPELIQNFLINIIPILIHSRYGKQIEQFILRTFLTKRS